MKGHLVSKNEANEALDGLCSFIDREDEKSNYKYTEDYSIVAENSIASIAKIIKNVGEDVIGKEKMENVSSSFHLSPNVHKTNNL